jgi:hypothetical protein
MQLCCSCVGMIKPCYMQPCCSCLDLIGQCCGSVQRVAYLSEVDTISESSLLSLSAGCHELKTLRLSPGTKRYSAAHTMFKPLSSFINLH